MRVIIMKKNTAIKIIAFAALFLGVFFVHRYMTDDTVAVMAQEESTAMPVCAVDTTDKKIALTIDTAFGEDKTSEILATLSEHGVKATFCVTGMWANENPELMGNIVAGGHEVISHSMQHGQYTDMTAEEIVADADAARECLKTFTGTDCYLLRLPYGMHNDTVLTALSDAGYTAVKWSVDARDWETDDAKAILDNAVSDTIGGDIVMIQNNTSSYAALNDMLASFAQNGYSVVTLSGLLPAGPFETDSMGIAVASDAEQPDGESVESSAVHDDSSMETAA